jgi:hypothetical protein
VPRRRAPFEPNADAYLLFHVLGGSVHVKFASGFDKPPSMDASAGDMYVVRPFYLYGMRKTSDDTWAWLCVHSR